MDNKRWGKRFSTIFWWSLTILPLIIVLIQFIGFHLTFNSGISTAQELVDYHTNFEGNFFTIFENYLMDGSTIFGSYTLPFITDMFLSLFDTLQVGSYDYLSILFSWMVSVQFYHLIFDFIVWLPKWFHNILEKGVGKID